MNETRMFKVDGQEVAPNVRQRLGLLLVFVGGWLLKGGKPVSVTYRGEPPS